MLLVSSKMLPRLYNTGDTAIRGEVGTGGVGVVPTPLPLNPIPALRNDEGSVGEGGKCDASNFLPLASPPEEAIAPFLDESVPATDRRIFENDAATESRRLAVVVGLSGGFSSSPLDEP